MHRVTPGQATAAPCPDSYHRHWQQQKSSWSLNYFWYFDLYYKLRITEDKHYSYCNGTFKFFNDTKIWLSTSLWGGRGRQNTLAFLRPPRLLWRNRRKPVCVCTSFVSFTVWFILCSQMENSCLTTPKSGKGVGRIPHKQPERKDSCPRASWRVSTSPSPPKSVCQQAEC